jgi:hypothetical protein
MPLMDGKQLILKPQDLVVVLKLASNQSYSFTYADLADQLKLSTSQVHGSVGRARLAKLVRGSQEEKPVPIKAALREFVLFGARYAFPPVFGPATRGMETAHAAPPLNSMIAPTSELPPVWPDPHGAARGLALYPLYPNATIAAKRDRVLYELLALFDALRGGAAREREMAMEMLQERLA